jgi:hypothetical protein
MKRSPPGEEAQHRQTVVAGRLLASAGLAALLVGCAQQPATHAGMNAAMAAWKGRWVAEAVGMWGMPDSIRREGTEGVLVWRGEEHPDAPAPPQPGSEPWPLLCTRVLTVDAAEIIRSARWQGQGCSTDPADYAPR